MRGIIDTIICWVQWLAGMGIFGIVQAVNLIMNVLADLVNAAISILPDAAIAKAPAPDSGIVATANFFLPIGPLVVEAGVIIVAWGIYRIYRYIFRWFI